MINLTPLPDSQKHRGSVKTVLVTLAVLFVLLIAITIAVPNFLGGRTRSPVSRVQADLRFLATGIEAYYVEHNEYPAWSSTDGEIDWHFHKSPASAGVPTFMLRDATRQIATLTTPVAFVTSYFVDLFAPFSRQTFAYYSTANGWIMWSPGPDGKYDLNVDNIPSFYNPKNTGHPTQELIFHTFDPTNGTTSAGDIWRVKQ